ncbi:serine/threonine-protein kinase [Pseudactinotalea sp. Z1739]|uniref:serine/threonine-protein kinase n=1 Tax=Pseudactinotalea sp. Z1739 TaxID=3413028 RepID=UPI003C7BEF07
MAPSRPPSQPPQIPGFTYERLLGSGGFADVFLYTQQLPRRSVAVKVLLAPTTDAASREQFVAEANVMAQLSAHPSIVTIYHADTADDGRPYLMMEYCPRPNLSVRYRTAPLGVAEALRIGVRLGGAVETAHRAGILHRDIKPANVLTTDYGWPALTDFGISVVQHASEESEAVGMSIPWSAPEFFDEHAERGTPGDIYALAATVYTLLAGRSPFELREGKNSALDIIGRIERDPLPPLLRDDVPHSLEQVLQRGMAKAPEQRFGTAAEFARALQRVEQELQLAQTSLDLPDTSWIQVPDTVGEDLRTRVRSVVEIPAAPRTGGNAVDTEATRVRTPAVVPAADSAGAPAQAGRDGPPHAGVGPDQEAGGNERRGRRLRWLTLAASILVILVVSGVVIYGAANAPDDPPPPTDPTTAPPDPPVTDASRPGPPEQLTGQRVEGEDEVTFTWRAPEFDADLAYAWRQVAGADTGTERITETEITLTDVPERVCVEVAAISVESSRLSEWSEACA